MATDRSLGFSIGATDNASRTFAQLSVAVDRATKSVNKLDRSSAAPALNADDATLQAKIAKAGAKLDELSRQTASPQVMAETGRATADMARIEQRLAQLDSRQAVIEARADVAAARAELNQLDRQADALDRKQVNVDVDVDSDGLGRATSGTSLLASGAATAAAGFRQISPVIGTIASGLASVADAVGLISSPTAELAKTGAELMVLEQRADSLGRKQVTIKTRVDEKGLTQAAAAAARLAVGATSAAAAVAGIGAAIPAVGALAAAFVSAAGAAALIPAALAGAGAVFGSLKLGLGGISDAYTAVTAADTGGAGAAAGNAAARVAAARQVESAQRALADAYRNADRQAIQSAQAVGDAQRAVARAQASAAQAIAAASDALADAQVSAAQRVADAQQALDRAVVSSAERVRAARERVADAQVSAARRVTSAEQSLERAQRTATDAQEALNRAREDAAEQLEELQDSLDGAALDEEGAVLALERARERLAKMPRNASALDWAEAELGVKQAELALKQTQDRYKELQEESTEAAEAGIDGSEQVQDAQQDLDDAVQQVADSEAALQQARLDGAEEVADAQAALAQAQVDAAQQVADAQESLRRAQIDGAKSVADAEENLRQAQIDGAQSVADAQESLARAQQAAAWAAEDSARSIEDAQRSLAEALEATGAAGGAAAGGIDAAAAAMAKLSPNARDLVNTLAKLKPAWDAIKFDVQDTLLEGVSKKVEALAGRYFPLLNVVLSDVAKSFNGAFHDVSDLLMTEKAAGDLNVGFSRVTTAVDTLTKAFKPLTQIFLDLFEVGSEFLPDLAQGFLDSTNRASEFVSEARKTGELRDWIAGGLDTLKQLGQLFSSTGSIIRTVLKAADDSGGGFLDTLVLLTGAAEAFLKSAEGQSALLAFFTSIHNTVQALLPGLQAIGSALSESIITLGPALPQIGEAFSNVAAAVAPLLPELAALAADILPMMAATLGGPVVAALGLFSGLLEGTGAHISDWVVNLGLLYAGFKVFTAIGRFGLILSLAGALTGLIPQLASVSAGLRTVGALIRGFATGGLAAAAGIMALVAVWDALTVSAGEAEQAIALVGSAASVEAVQGIAAQSVALDLLRSKFGAVGSTVAGIADLFTTTSAEMKEGLDGVGLAQYAAAESLGRYNAAVAQHGKDSPQAIAAQEDYAGAVDEVAQRQQDAEDATKSHTDRMQEQLDQMSAAANSSIAYRQALLQVKDAQDAANEATAKYGTGSREAEEANLRLEQSVLRVADAAARKAEEDAKAAGVQDTAAIRTAAYTQNLLSQAAGLEGPARTSMLNYIAGLDASTLSAVSAQNATSGFKTEVLTLPDGRTVTVLADPTQAMATLELTTAAIDGAVATITIDGNPDPATGKVQGTIDLGNGAVTTVTLDANPDPATGKITGTVDMGNGSLATITLDGNPDPATGKINATVTDGNGRTSQITVDANNLPAWARTNEVVDHGNRQHPQFPVEADVSPAERMINWVRDLATRGASFVVSAITGNAAGNYYKAMAAGGVLEMASGGNLASGMRKMSANRAEIVPPNTKRVIGDRARGDEAFIPINDSGRSQQILKHAASEMGWDLVPKGTLAALIAQRSFEPVALRGQVQGGDGASAGRGYSNPALRGSPVNVTVDLDPLLAEVKRLRGDVANLQGKTVNYAPTIIGTRQDRTADALAMDARTASDQGIFG